MPAFGNPATKDEAPKLAERKRLLFLTTIDFPPFNFVAEDKRLIGFHVDLARALCEELNYSAICQIQALPWQELHAALKEKKGDAIISGIAITKSARKDFLFTRSYFQFPGRFLAKSKDVEAFKNTLTEKGIRIASIEGSAHQAYVKAYFKDAIHIAYDTKVKAMEALNKGEVALYFDDGLSLANLLNKKPELCMCEMVGGAYFSKAYFGHGLAIALDSQDVELKKTLDWGLSKLYEKGVMQELYLRYFPIDIF